MRMLSMKTIFSSLSLSVFRICYHIDLPEFYADETLLSPSLIA